MTVAGLGQIKLVDHDQVDVTHLHRQVLHTQADLNQDKVTSAKASLLALNPDCNIHTINHKLSPEGMFDQVSQHDRVVDYTGLCFMFVEQEFRGQGINRVIMNKLISWGNMNGATDFYLDVYISNQSAIRAYEKAGFNPSLLEIKLSTNGLK